MYTNDYSNLARCRKQTHNHEFLGSTRFAEEGDDRHNHRFAGVTSEAISHII